MNTTEGDKKIDEEEKSTIKKTSPDSNKEEKQNKYNIYIIIIIIFIILILLIILYKKFCSEKTDYEEANKTRPVQIKYTTELSSMDRSSKNSYNII